MLPMCHGVAQELGFRTILFEIDCVLLYHAWKARVDNPSYLSSIVHDCLSLESSFNSCRLVHVKRQCNAEADYLARKSFNSLSHMWLKNG